MEEKRGHPGIFSVKEILSHFNLFCCLGCPGCSTEEGLLVGRAELEATNIPPGTQHHTVYGDRPAQNCRPLCRTTPGRDA